jgi:LysR family glycine cleavage system transcriptional activator
MRKLPPLNSLRAFEAAARLGGVTNASEELHVTHGAVSRQLKQLEQWLEVELFDRSERTIKLNKAGESYLKHVTGALDLIEQASLSLKQSLPEKSLKISTTHSIASKWLVEKLNEFSKVHPFIDIWLTTQQQKSDFSTQKFDMSIRMGEGPWPNLHCVALAKDSLIVVASPDLVEDNLKKAEDLRNFTLIHDQDPNTHWLRWYQENQLTVEHDINVGPRYSSSDIVLESAINRQGVALVSERLARADVAAGKLVQVLQQTVNLGDYFWLVMPRENSLDYNVQSFCHWLLENIE